MSMAALSLLPRSWWSRQPPRRLDSTVAALEQAGEAQIVVDEAGDVVFASRAALDMVGRPSLARQDDLLDAMAARVQQRDELERLARSAAGGAAASVELTCGTNGSTCAWLVAATPVDGYPGTVRWRISDITADRAQAAELWRSEAALRAIVDGLPVGLYEVDADGTFRFANATLAAWLGVGSPAQLVAGYRLDDFVAAPETDAVGQVLTPLDGGTVEGPSSTEVRMRGLDGRTFTAAVAQLPVETSFGALPRIRGVVRDLGPERRMNETLRASELRYRRFFEDAPIGLALVDEATRLTEWNPAFVRLIGGEAAELAGKRITELVDEADRKPVRKRLASVLEGRLPEAAFEVRLQGPRPLVVSLAAKRLAGEGGRPSGLILQFIDETERKNLETQVAQTQKMQAVGQLAGGIAHDFNNLLTAMIGFCDLLLLRHRAGDASFGDIMQIKQNANRAANLVRQLLAFSRRQTLQPRVLTITDTLADLSNLLRRLIGENIELRMVHGRDLWPVKVDEGQLEQVIINLAVNARDAMAGGGRLTITTGNVATVAPVRRGAEEMPPGEYVTIEVQDTGTGIPSEIIDRIFEPFFSTKEVGQGTGLGLSTVYGIVRQTGGYVFVDSVLGRGARFTIFLPRHEVEVEAEPAAGPEPKESSARDLTGVGRILLVEDEDPVRLFSARALRNKGYEVLEASSGDQALELLASDQRPVDLLITDVVMPKMDGPTLIKHVRVQRPDMKVICISGYAEDKFRENSDVAEGVHFLAKPFSLKQLAAKVKDVVRGGE